MKIVVIDWVDSVRAFDWTLMEDVEEKPVDCISVGFLLKETDSHVTIAQNYELKPEQVCNLITIPKCSIKNIREIKERYTWKPSDEQMDALLKLEDMHVLEHEKNQENAHLYMVVKSLREQLLKLREE